MTTTVAPPQPPAARAGSAPAGPLPAELTRVLFDELGRLGVLVAELAPDDTAAWAAVRSGVASLSVAARQLARTVAGPHGDGRSSSVGAALSPTDAVPPVVWAREVAAIHRLLRPAVRELAEHGAEHGVEHGASDAPCAAELASVLHTASAVADDVAAAAGAARTTR